MNDILIYDDIINQDSLENINNLLVEGFPWFFTETTAENQFDFKDTFEHFQFVHLFIKEKEINSAYINFLEKIVDDLPFKLENIIRAKANFLPQVMHDEDKFNNPHVDSFIKHKVCIVYLNDSDGDTFIFDNFKNIIKRVTPKKGRVLIMNGNLIHTSSHPIKSKFRIILNINFEN
tara:strand:- start:1346 stop:1873 length:528 start_codon:yes stop_codon:yes gene_type:complete